MPPPQRIYYLDNLKILLAALVILLHAGQPFGPAEIGLSLSRRNFQW